MRIYTPVLLLVSMLLLHSCDKEFNIASRDHSLPTIIDSTETPSPGVNKKIKTSIKIHDDNVNGVYFRKKNTIQEAVRFFYNEDELLDSLVVLSDTSRNAKVLRSAKFRYIHSENRVNTNFYLEEKVRFNMDFRYDNDKKVLAISSKDYHKETGIFYIYDGNSLSHMKFDFVKVAIMTNFKYDAFNNLTKFETYSQTEDYFKVDIKYDLTREVSPTFDIKFNSVDIQFLYEGGVNIIDLMGLNIGEGNTHLISKRSESYLYDNGKSRNTYQYQYSFDAWGRMTNRVILLNEDTEILFQYQY